MELVSPLFLMMGLICFGVHYSKDQRNESKH